MNRPKLFKALRISWTVGWGVLAVLLCVLWVRSYFGEGSTIFKTSQFMSFTNADLINIPPKSWVIGIGSRNGSLSTVYLVDYDAFNSAIANGLELKPTVIGFAVNKMPGGGWRLAIPHWFTILVAATLAAIPWLRFQFSLRTLLITTTLIGVLMGLIVYAARR